jgi:hypothetical protein
MELLQTDMTQNELLRSNADENLWYADEKNPTCIGWLEHKESYLHLGDSKLD